MSTLLRFSPIVLGVTLVLLCSACGTSTSTAKRAGLTALGAAAGGAAGYAADHSPLGAALGAVAGAGITQLALGEDANVRQAGFDEGYVQGQSDAIKRQYFLRQALEAKPLADSSQGEIVHYVLPGPEVTVDGRKLAPHTVAVRVVE